MTSILIASLVLVAAFVFYVHGVSVLRQCKSAVSTARDLLTENRQLISENQAIEARINEAIAKPGLEVKIDVECARRIGRLMRKARSTATLRSASA